MLYLGKFNLSSRTRQLSSRVALHAMSKSRIRGGDGAAHKSGLYTEANTKDSSSLWCFTKKQTRDIEDRRKGLLESWGV